MGLSADTIRFSEVYLDVILYVNFFSFAQGQSPFEMHSAAEHLEQLATGSVTRSPLLDVSRQLVCIQLSMSIPDKFYCFAF